MTISYRYTPNTGGLANANSTSRAGGKPVGGDIDVDIYTGEPDDINTPPLLRFYDDTPATDEHWEMGQKLFRDLSGTEQTTRFGPNNLPPDLLEVSWRGMAKATAPADARNGYDLLLPCCTRPGTCWELRETAPPQATRDLSPTRTLPAAITSG